MTLGVIKTDSHFPEYTGTRTETTATFRYCHKYIIIIKNLEVKAMGKPGKYTQKNMLRPIKLLILLLIIEAAFTLPVYAEATISPNPIIKGQGLATLTVNVTNTGSSDTINVAAIVNGAVVTAVTNSLRLAQGQQGTYTFMLNPTVSATSDLTVSVIATAGGSGLQTRENVTLYVIVPPPEPERTPTGIYIVIILIIILLIILWVKIRK